MITIDSSDLLQRLRESELDDISVENEIVDILEELIHSSSDSVLKSSFNLLYANMFSGDSLQLNRKFITSDDKISYKANTLDISSSVNNSFTGIVTSENASHLFSDLYWREKDIVTVNNLAISAYGLKSNIDAMATYPMISKIFLGKEPGQELDSCTTSSIVGQVEVSSDNAHNAISFGDASRTYIKLNDSIDVRGKTVNVRDIKISNDEISGVDMGVSSRSISSLTSSSGLVLMSDVGQKYVDTGLNLSDDAVLKGCVTNIPTKLDTASKFKATKAPKNGWIAEDLVREGSIANEERTLIINEVLTGNTGQGIARNRPIVKEEVDSMISTVGSEIISKGFCQ